MPSSLFCCVRTRWKDISVQSLCRVRLFMTPWTAACQASLSHHQLSKLAHTRVHCVGDAIQPSHPLLSASPIFNLSQHWGLFQWVSSSHQVSKVLEFQLQHQSLQWTFRLKRYIDICKARSPNSDSAGIFILDFPAFGSIWLYVCYLWAA